MKTYSQNQLRDPCTITCVLCCLYRKSSNAKQRYRHTDGQTDSQGYIY